MTQKTFIGTFLALAFALPAPGGETTKKDLIYWQSGSSLRVSIETYQTRQGWTPVIVSVAGADVTAVMDAQGRVVSMLSKGPEKYVSPLFVIQMEKGRVILGGEAHPISVFEQNAVRTRFRMVESVIGLPLRLDAQGKRGALRFGGLEIPAQVNSVAPSPTNRTVRSAVTAPTALAKKERGAAARLQPQRIRARVK
jgi:hypothetical protein